jgi:peptidoglycan/LPS O-acetylase OafA/YrhL
MKSFPALDGVRLVSSWLVMTSHVVFFAGWFLKQSDELKALSGAPADLLFGGAWFGVDVFFFLSGFFLVNTLVQRKWTFAALLKKRWKRLVGTVLVCQLISFFLLGKVTHYLLVFYFFLFFF